MMTRPLFVFLIALGCLFNQPAFGRSTEWCTMMCLRQAPLGTENAEAEKQHNARCTGVCGSKEACEFVLKSPTKDKFNLRTVGGCVEREKQR
jgi:hypothetical protein